MRAQRGGDGSHVAGTKQSTGVRITMLNLSASTVGATTEMQHQPDAATVFTGTDI